MQTVRTVESGSLGIFSSLVLQVLPQLQDLSGHRDGLRLSLLFIAIIIDESYRTVSHRVAQYSTVQYTSKCKTSLFCVS